MEGEDADVVQSPDQISVISGPVAKPVEPKQKRELKVQHATCGWCFAMYEYDATAPDELNLEEGQACIASIHT